MSQLSELLVLRRGVATGHHFYGHATVTSKFMQQLQHIDRTQIVASWVGNHCHAAACRNEFNRLLQVHPLVLNKTRLAFHQIFLKYRFGVFNQAQFHQVTGKMHTGNDALLSQTFGALVGIGYTGFGQALAHLLCPLIPRYAHLG